MAIFVTGASGFIGSAVAELLIKERGYRVTGLARSDAAAAKLESIGVIPRRGDLSNPADVAAAANESEGMIHCAMAWGPRAGDVDRAAVESSLNALERSGKPFVYSSGVWVMGDTKGRLAGEAFPLKPPALVAWRPAVERMVFDTTVRGIRGVVIRPARVYGRGGGPVARIRNGAEPIVGDGENHWSFIHVDDLAELYVLAYERAPAGSLYVAADGPPVKLKDLAAACGIGTFLPLEQAREKIGALADALVMDQRIGSTRAGRELGWKPSRPGILEEIRQGRA